MQKQILKIDGIKRVLGTVDGLCDSNLKTAFYVAIDDDDAVYTAISKSNNFVYYPDYDNGTYIIGVLKN